MLYDEVDDFFRIRRFAFIDVTSAAAAFTQKHVVVTRPLQPALFSLKSPSRNVFP